MRIAAVGRAFPEHYYDQDTLAAGLRRLWGPHVRNTSRLERIARNVRVHGRHLALPMAAYQRPRSFGESNDAFMRCAVDLGERAISDALGQADVAPTDVDAIFFVSVTGLGAPSVDARLVNRMGLRCDVKRTPIFGLGCVAGAAGIARCADYLRAYPDQVAVLLSVELCSLTLQPSDRSVPNIIATALFGDGAAAVVMLGATHRRASGPRVLGSRSVFYRDTEDVMGWQITGDGFRIVLSGSVPRVVQEHIRRDVDSFLASHGLRIGDIDHFVCHPGGPKVLEAFAQALEVPSDALAVTWESLRDVGNMSSASVLMVLRETLERRSPQPGQHGLILAMGPGFCSELVLIQW